MIFSFPFVKECYENRAWGFAHEHCRAIGARMCTEEEALAGVGAFKGCGFNSQYIWTSTECVAEESKKGYKMVIFRTRETQCSLDNPTTKGRFSCCADASICSTCTDVLQTPENQCQIWSNSGYCADGHKFKSYMRQNCARTCGFDCTITDTAATTTTQTTISVSTTATSKMTTASTSTTSTAITSTFTSTSTFTPTVPTSKIISGTTSRLLPPPPPTSTTASAETVKTTSTAISPATETESAPGSTVSTRTSEAAAKPTDATSTATTRPVEIVVTKQAGSPTNPLAKGFNVTVAPTLSGSGDSIASTLATTLATTTFATSATTLPSDLSSTLESQALISAVVTVLLVAAMVAVSIKWACAAGKCKRTFMATRSSSAIVRNPAWTPTGTPESTPPGTLKEDTSSDSSNLPIESSLHVAPAYAEPTGTLTSAKYAEPDEGSQTQHVEYAEPEEAQYEEYNKGDVQIAMHTSSANSAVPNVAPFDSTGSSSTAVNGNRQNPKIVQIYGDVRDTDDEDDGGDPNTACDASITNSSGFDDGPPLPAKGAADWSAYDTTINTLYSSTADVATASGNPNDYEASGSTFTTSAGNDQSASSWAGYDTTANVLYSGTGPLLGGSQLEDKKDARPRTLPSTSVEGLTYATIADVENGSTNEAPLSPSLAANAMRLKLQKVENENYMLPSSSTSPVYDVDRNGPVVDTVLLSMYASTENALSTGKAGSDCQVHDNAFEPNGLQVEKGVLRVKSARRSNPLFSTDATYAVPLKKSERRKPEDGTKGVAPANNAAASSEYEMPWGFAEQHTMEQRTLLTNQGISSASLDTGARAYDAFSEDQPVAAANQSRRPYDGFGKPKPQNDGASVYNILGRRHVDQPASTTKCVRVSRHGKKKKKKKEKKEKKKEKKEKKEKKKQNKKGKGGKDGGPSSSAAPPIDDGGSAVSWAVPSGSGEGTFVVVQVPGTTRTELFYSDTRSSVSSGGEGIYQNAAFAAEHVMHQSDFWFAGAVSRPVCNKAVLSAVPGSFWVRCSARADNPRGYVLCINDYGGASNFQIVAAKDGLVFAGHRYNCVSDLLYALREAPLQSRNRPGALLRLGDPAPGGSVLHELAPERSPAEAPEHTYSRLGNFDGADVDDADGPSEIMVNDTVFRSVAPDPSVYAEFGGEGEAVEISDDEDWA